MSEIPCLGRRGRIVERAFIPDERTAMDDALSALGETTFDVYLNGRAFWRNVPAVVWRYKPVRISGSYGRKWCTDGLRRAACLC